MKEGQRCLILASAAAVVVAAAAVSFVHYCSLLSSLSLTELLI
jgi:hypothetical protein